MFLVVALMPSIVFFQPAEGAGGDCMSKWRSKVAATVLYFVVHTCMQLRCCGAMQR